MTIEATAYSGVQGTSNKSALLDVLPEWPRQQMGTHVETSMANDEVLSPRALLVCLAKQPVRHGMTGKTPRVAHPSSGRLRPRFRATKKASPRPCAPATFRSVIDQPSNRPIICDHRGPGILHSGPRRADVLSLPRIGCHALLRVK